MTFHHTDGTAHFGTAFGGSTPLDLTAPAPFKGLALTGAALAEVLRLHATRHTGGQRADLTGADLIGANLRRASLTGANLTGADLTGARWRE